MARTSASTALNTQVPTVQALSGAEYLAAVTAHSSYWADLAVSLFWLKRILRLE